jgi:periplasmic divalent cation tolerance protein
MTDKIVVLTACESADEAAKIARALVDQRLAACVNIASGARSVYRWKGEIEEAAEWLLFIKTSRALLSEVRTALEKLHSYELPECVALPIVDGSEGYLDWIDHALKQSDPTPR